MQDSVHLLAGVFLYSRIVVCESVPSSNALDIIFLAFFTADSTIPLDLGYPGLLVRCSTSHFFMNRLNSSQ